ncbi:MAG: SAM-dependent methyltransferase [Bacillota bacterium]|nr:MAG: hypothetical protein DIU70_09690 [Bacillota bacterium]
MSGGRSPVAFVATAQPEYARHALAELRQAAGGGRAEPLAEGVFLFQPRGDPEAVRAGLAAQPPVFLRHLHPVHRALALPDLRPEAGAELRSEAVADACGSTASGLAPLVEATWDLLAGGGAALPPPGAAVQVQVRRLGLRGGPSAFAVKAALDPVLAAAGFRPVSRDPEWVLSVTLCGAPAESRGGAAGQRLAGDGGSAGAAGACRAFLGLSTPAENLSPWPGGAIHYPRAAVISRAAFKLMEALELFAPLGFCLRPGDRALDLGAAPGGWTQVLLDRGLQVTAVDPAPLDPRLQGRPGLTFLQGRAGEVPLPPAAFDLVTCDINWHPLETARTVAARAEVLVPGGWALVTVKLLGGGNPTAIWRRAADILAGAGLRLVAARQLFHNRDEVTLLLRRAD